MSRLHPTVSITGLLDQPELSDAFFVVAVLQTPDIGNPGSIQNAVEAALQARFSITMPVPKVLVEGMAHLLPILF